MTTFKITYMVDPGDGIESTTEIDSDDGAEYFVTKCEIVAHSLMVEQS
jgi:hypothetical protein